MKESMRKKIFRKLEIFKASLLPHLRKDDIRIEFKRLDIEIKKLDREE